MRVLSRSGIQNAAQAGDTIVEVLIAMAVVSLVLLGAFVTSNQSSQATRDSQEHAEATQDIKTQIELARLAISTAPNDASDPTATADKLFCIVQSGNSAVIEPFNNTGYTNNGTALLPLDSDTFQNYPSQCHQDAGSYNYYIAVENHTTNPSIAPNTLLAHARWDKLGGGRDEVTFAYRAHAAIQGIANAPSSCVIDSTASNIVRNPDFSVLPNALNVQEGDSTDPAQFTSYLPYRGNNLYPDDDGINASSPSQHAYGGFAIFNNGTPVKVTNGTISPGPPPYVLYGNPLGSGKVPDGHNVTSFFYSNPVESVSQAEAHVPKPGEYASYQGVIWTETNLPVTPHTNYQFQMWVSNIKLKQVQVGYSGDDVDPLIELKVLSGNTVIADIGGNSGIDIHHMPNDLVSPADWQFLPLNVNTNTATNLTLQILDHAGRIHDDDFTMTGLGLYACD